MTIAGHHTVAELGDWLKALDYQIAQIQDAVTLFAPRWKARDPNALKAWADDWAAFIARYRGPHDAGAALVASSSFPNVHPAEDEWQAVLVTLEKVPGQVQRGDFQDLYTRLSDAQGAPVDVSKTPQPTAPDADLAGYQAADATIHAGKAALGKALSPGTLILVGALAGAALFFLVPRRL